VSKIYDRGNPFLLSLDRECLLTYLLEVNVPELSVKIAAIEKLNEIGNEKFNTTNSYLYKDKIFQIGGNKTIMVVTVKEIGSEKELKRLVFSKDEEIPFKNSGIIEDYTTNRSFKTEELETSKLLLKMFNKGNSGVAVSPTSNGYQLTIGASETITQGGGGGMVMIGGSGGGMTVNSTGSGMVVTSSFNPTFYSFGGYSYGVANKTRRIECLFNNNFEHVEGEVPQNIFNRLRTHTLNLPKAKAETVFKQNDFMVYGRYFEKENIYKLFKFSE
jgi:hypothetical protein